MLFNTVGYRFAFSFLETRSTVQLELAIDEGNYEEQNLIEIQIPLNMPYLSDKEYEVAYGETNINGIQYQYVKRKISNNTLYMLCLPNIDKSNLVAAKNNIEKNDIELNQHSSNKKNPAHSITKSLQQEYLQSTKEHIFKNDPFVLLILPKIRNNKSGNLFTALTPSQPPENRI